ncbi:unnamed protein product, partial [Cyprideis torosa]
MVKTDMPAVESVMHHAAQIMALLAQTAEPFLPNTSAKSLDMIDAKLLDWNELKDGKYLLPEGHQLNESSLLFSKIEDDWVANQLDKLEKSKMENKPQHNLPPIKDEIQFDDFMKMDIRVGKILTAAKVEKADKLLHFTVDMGTDQRSIVSGVAEHYTPEDMVGKQVLVLTNLAPRKIRGVESKGMILFAENAEGKLVLVAPEMEVESGSQ